MKAFSLLLLCITLVALLPGLACRTQAQPKLADAFWQNLQDSDYTNWARAPDYEEPQETVGAHGELAIIYTNDVAVQALNSDGFEAWPVGTILVKDSFNEGSPEIEVIAAMEKREDGWYWAEWKPNGELLYSGGGAEAPGVCTGCHEDGEDYVLGVFSP